MGLRKVQCQRGQSIHHAKVAHVAAVNGFHADDADNDLCGHAELLLGTRERLVVGLPELHAGAYAHGVDKAAAVYRPVLHKGLASRRHQACDHRQVARFAQLRTHPVDRQVAADCDFFGQLHGVAPTGIGHGRGGCSRGYGSRCCLADGFFGWCGDDARSQQAQGQSTQCFSFEVLAVIEGDAHVLFLEG